MRLKALLSKASISLSANVELTTSLGSWSILAPRCIIANGAETTRNRHPALKDVIAMRLTWCSLLKNVIVACKLISPPIHDSSYQE